MTNRDLQAIEHMKMYCERISASVYKHGNCYNTFIDDVDFFDAISMRILQIGELSNKLSDGFKEKYNSSIPWKAIRGIRNRIAHEYSVLDTRELWSTVLNDVPTLSNFCDEVLINEHENIMSLLNEDNPSSDEVEAIHFGREDFLRDDTVSHDDIDWD